MTHTKSRFVMATLLLSSLFTLPAYAQSANGAPIFTLPNFRGDARVDDLYIYMHEPSRPPWDEYRQRLHDAARRIENQQPLQESPSPATIQASPGAYAFATMVNNYAQAGGTGNQGGQSHQESQQQTAASATASNNTAGGSYQTAQLPPQPQVTTSVSGAVMMPPVDGAIPDAMLGGGAMPIPGLVGP
jgi:hypothetical protein